MADLTSKRRFPIKIETHETTVLDAIVGSYVQYIVSANNFVIASFVDATSRASYLSYLKNYGFNKFPVEIIKAMEYLQSGIPPNDTPGEITLKKINGKKSN